MSEKKSVEKWVFLILGAGAGFLAASLLSGSPDLPQETSSDQTLETTSAQVASSGAPVKKPEGGEGLNPSKVEARDLYGEIVDANIGEFPSILQNVLALDPNSPQQDALLDLLFDRWALEDPVGSLEAASDLRGTVRDSAFKSALTRLGTEDFEKSLDWLNENMTYSERSSTQFWLYVGLAKKDPLLAIEEIDKLGDGEIKESALMNVASEWAKTDITAAFEWYENAPWNGKMVEVYDRLISAFLKQKPDEARAFIDAMPDDLYRKKTLQLELAALLASSGDVGAALELSENLEDPQRKESALTNVFEVWAEADPEAAFSKAMEMAKDESMEPSTRNNVTRQAAFALLWEDIDKLQENYSEIPGDIREELVAPFVERLMMEDPERAREWAQNLPPDSVEFNLGISGIAMALNDWNPEEAIRAAQAMTYSEIRDDNIYSSLKSLYKQNPVRALEIASDPNLVSTSNRDSLARWVQEYGDQKPDIYIPGSAAEE